MVGIILTAVSNHDCTSFLKLQNARFAKDASKHEVRSFCIQRHKNVIGIYQAMGEGWLL